LPGALQHLMRSPGCGAQLLLMLLYEGAQLLVVELRVEVVRDCLQHQKHYKMDNLILIGWMRSRDPSEPNVYGFLDSDPAEPDPFGSGSGPRRIQNFLDR
jgi:hypothetical protein